MLASLFHRQGCVLWHLLKKPHINMPGLDQTSRHSGRSACVAMTCLRQKLHQEKKKRCKMGFKDLCFWRVKGGHGQVNVLSDFSNMYALLAKILCIWANSYLLQFSMIFPVGASLKTFIGSDESMAVNGAFGPQIRAAKKIKNYAHMHNLFFWPI